MFGIGGGEMIFIIFIALMLFGTDKIPEFARTFGKGMAQLRNATNEIKNEIHKSAEANGFDKNSLTGGLTEDIQKLKQEFTALGDPVGIQKEIDEIGQNLKLESNDPLHLGEVTSDLNNEIEKAKADLDSLAPGPIKRQM
jgi:sec-independent protein translocase protein TatA